MGSPKQLGFTLKACGWRAQFTPVSDKRAASAKPMHDRYRLSHQVEFTREDGSLFTAAEAEDFLAKLSLFLSFCHGQWVATSFIAAVNPSGEVALEQWGTGRVSPWREPSGWLDEHHGDSICQLYGPFCEKLQDKSWGEALNLIVYWFARAETNIVGPDGACILLQATLERFAWHVLVRDRKTTSERRYNELTARDHSR